MGLDPLTKHDYRRIESFIRGYELLKLRMDDEIHISRKQNMRQIVQGIREVYNSLPLEEQQLFRLLYWEAQRPSYDIIAAALNVSERSVKRHRERLMERVADAIIYI
ncbi:hypothetical protein [Macrococcus equipercicus]|nr:hypothetical protein [Macrococcus equipercicus]